MKNINLKTWIKMNLFAIIVLSLATTASQAQEKKSKPPINNDTYKTWPTLRGYSIANNGKYAFYEYWSAGSCLVICSTDGKYKRELTGASSANFTADSRHLIFDSPKGLGILAIAEDTIHYIKSAEYFATPKEGKMGCIAYRRDGGLILQDLNSGKEISYPNTTRAWFNDLGTSFFVQTATGLVWTSLPKGEMKTIMHKSSTNNVAFDKTGTKIAFVTAGPKEYVLRYYQLGMDTAIIHIDNNTSGISAGLTISDKTPQFSQNGQSIFFKLAPNKSASKPTQDNIVTTKVDVWNYKDSDLQSWQATQLPGLERRTYTAVTAVNSSKVIQLESADTVLRWPVGSKPGNDYALINNIINANETYWNKNDIANYQIVSLANGIRKNIVTYPHEMLSCQLSPAEQYVTWYDPVEKNYFSYEVSTATTRNITQPIRVSLDHDDEHRMTIGVFPHGTGGWLEHDDALLIYDRYDIWQVDPSGRKPPINITGGFGRSHRISFRVVTDNSNPKITDTLLLTALNRDNKYNGFWKKRVGTTTAPDSCGTMAPCLYYYPSIDINAFSPLKAKNASIYLVQRMTEKDPSNLFATADFKTFIALSDIHPEKKYNWMTSELIHWKMPNGNIGDAILYKPENFDPAKKYPVIFYYYEQFSNEVFSFKAPELCTGPINIPWYVSNGYLVCVPDIFYTRGHTGESAVNSVVSAAKYLAGFSWVDAGKMGLNGHSFGGYETNYLVTHSNLFAAAQSSAGLSDMASWYGGISFGGQSTAYQCEAGQSNLHTTPWQSPEIYVGNSPVYYLDNVTTPLLIMHNKEDEAAPFSHSIAMFTGLRRLQKPVWLLQYDGEGHVLTDTECRLDFSIRQQQFFDHYLKGKPAPLWMAEGIPAKYKGIKSGLVLSGQ